MIVTNSLKLAGLEFVPVREFKNGRTFRSLTKWAEVREQSLATLVF